MNHDILIVGNGILSVSTAFEILKRDPTVRVAILGSRLRTGGASWAAGAMLNCFAEVTKYSMASSAGKAKFKMARTALDLWPGWLEEINARIPLSAKLAMHPGTVVIENAVSGHLDSENFDAILAVLHQFGEAYETVRGDDVVGFTPVPTARAFRCVYLPREGSIDSGAAYDGISQAVVNLGGVFVDAEATELLVDSNRVRGVRLVSGETLSAGTVVCAAGAFTSRLLDHVSPEHSIQPVFSGTGVAFVAARRAGEGFANVIRTVTRAGSCGLHAVPLASGREYIGATNAVFSKPQFHPTAGLSHFLLQCAIDQLDQGLSTTRIVEWRVGNRPIALDTYPLIGWSAVEQLYVMTGTYRDGFHGSPLIARISADDLLCGTSQYRHPFQPTRRPISTMSAEASASECVYHATCTGFEGSLVLPRLWRHEALSLLFVEMVRDVYRRLRTDKGLPPELLPFLAGAALAEGEDAVSFERVQGFIAARGLADDLEDTSAEGMGF